MDDGQTKRAIAMLAKAVLALRVDKDSLQAQTDLYYLATLDAEDRPATKVVTLGQGYQAIARRLANRPE
jgi:hypothetical protein